MTKKSLLLQLILISFNIILVIGKIIWQIYGILKTWKWIQVALMLWRSINIDLEIDRVPWNRDHEQVDSRSSETTQNIDGRGFPRLRHLACNDYWPKGTLLPPWPTLHLSVRREREDRDSLRVRSRMQMIMIGFKRAGKIN